MKYTVLDRGDDLSRKLAADFHRLAQERGMERNDDHPDVVVSIGGDGTMLKAFHVHRGRMDHVAFVGVHTGHLGFYADWKAAELTSLADAMASTGDDLYQRIVHYPLVEVNLVSDHGTESYVALNELTIKGVEATLVANLNINDESFEMFRGDGICISTPSGSTAYNKSVGGALIHPSLEAIQIAEIASINNRVFRTLGSSMILPKHHHCDIIPRRQQNLLVVVDHVALQRGDLISIRCRVSPSKVRFVRYRPFPFWNRVRDAFVGNLRD